MGSRDEYDYLKAVCYDNILYIVISYLLNHLHDKHVKL